MSGVGLSSDFSGVDALRVRVQEMANFDQGGLLDIIGATVESQTRRRIEDDKAAPDDGMEWPDWSLKYAKTRHGGHSLLESEGYLLASMTHNVSGDTVEVGSNMVYAATHQFGDEERHLPARPYLGLSIDDRGELETDILQFLRTVVP